MNNETKSSSTGARHIFTKNFWQKVIKKNQARLKAFRDSHYRNGKLLPWFELITKYENLLMFLVCLFVYCLTLYPTVSTEDAGELIVSASVLDIAHPPGYPIYVIFGKIFSTIIPFGSIAWRINFMSAFFTAASVTVLYRFLKKALKQDTVAFAISLFFAFTNILWSQTVRAEVYSLNLFFAVHIIFFLHLWHLSFKKNSETGKIESKNAWLYWAILMFGLGMSNHHQMALLLPPMVIFILLRNIKIVLNYKAILASIGVLILGLLPYAYLPIRTAVAPYDNPAFIEHDSLADWKSFINFVNRKIYGGTVNSSSTPTTGSTTQQQFLPPWLLELKDYAFGVTDRMIENSKVSISPFTKIVLREYYYIPLFFIIPGLYLAFRKDWRWGIFLTTLLLFNSFGLFAMIALEPYADTLQYHSAHPFMIPAIMMLGIFTAYGIAWLKESLENKYIQRILAIAVFILPILTLTKNFQNNNESRNYIADDFNRFALESLPQGATLISIGRDNMTFPLYYLRKIEQLRPDVKLEIYYSTSAVDKSYLQQRLEASGQKSIFIDLLPANSKNLNLKPYNFVYQFGDDPSLPPSTPEKYHIRNIESTGHDYPNKRMKALYYIKKGIAAGNKTDEQKKNFFIVINTIDDNWDLIGFIGDYCYEIGDLETAKAAYTRSGSTEGMQKVKNLEEGIIDRDTEFYQAGMS